MAPGIGGTGSVDNRVKVFSLSPFRKKEDGLEALLKLIEDTTKLNSSWEQLDALLKKWEEQKASIEEDYTKEIAKEALVRTVGRGRKQRKLPMTYHGLVAIFGRNKAGKELAKKLVSLFANKSVSFSPAEKKMIRSRAESRLVAGRAQIILKSKTTSLGEIASKTFSGLEYEFVEHKQTADKLSDGFSSQKRGIAIRIQENPKLRALFSAYGIDPNKATLEQIKEIVSFATNKTTVSTKELQEKLKAFQPKAASPAESMTEGKKEVEPRHGYSIGLMGKGLLGGGETGNQELTGGGATSLSGSAALHAAYVFNGKENQVMPFASVQYESEGADGEVKARTGVVLQTPHVDLSARIGVTGKLNSEEASSQFPDGTSLDVAGTISAGKQSVFGTAGLDAQYFPNYQISDITQSRTQISLYGGLGLSPWEGTAGTLILGPMYSYTENGTDDTKIQELNLNRFHSMGPSVRYLKRWGDKGLLALKGYALIGLEDQPLKPASYGGGLEAEGRVGVLSWMNVVGRLGYAASSDRYSTHVLSGTIGVEVNFDRIKNSVFGLFGGAAVRGAGEAGSKFENKDHNVGLEVAAGVRAETSSLQRAGGRQDLNMSEILGSPTAATFTKTQYRVADPLRGQLKPAGYKGEAMPVALTDLEKRFLAVFNKLSKVKEGDNSTALSELVKRAVSSTIAGVKPEDFGDKGKEIFAALYKKGFISRTGKNLFSFISK